MKNLKTVTRIVKVLLASSIILSTFSCEKSSDDVDNDCDGKPCIVDTPAIDNAKPDDVKPDDTNPDDTKAAIPTIGTIDGDWDFDIAQRGLIEISGCGGPVYIDCQWVPCDPIATTIVECKYPNGFCKTITVSGGINTTGGDTTSGNNGQQTIQYDIFLPGGDGTITTVITPTLPVKKAQGAILRINLPDGGQINEEELIDKLKKDRIALPKETTIEDVAKIITTNFNIKEDASLSPNLIAEFQKNNSELKIESITILKGEYPITKTKNNPNGYIDALITVKGTERIAMEK